MGSESHTKSIFLNKKIQNPEEKATENANGILNLLVRLPQKHENRKEI